MIDKFGMGLSVLILCEATGGDNFMSCAAWYSLWKSLPDAKVAVACRRPESMRYEVLRWAYRFHVPVFYYTEDPVRTALDRGLAEPLLVLRSDVMCLSPLDDSQIGMLSEGITNGETLCLAAKNASASPFCSLSGGCGAFVPSRWIDKDGHPFGKVDLLGRGDLTVNEKRIFSLWRKLCPLYDTIV